MSEKFENLLAVCSFLGTSGYNYHARGFFTALNKLLPVGIRNWSYDDNPYYLTNEQKAMMAAANGNSFSFGNCITICLHETNHEDWFKHDYKSPKIAFNVWESTRQPEQFFRKMLEFDQIWVPSKWQKKYTVEQGAPEDRVFIIPEGIDVNRFKLLPPTNTFKFSSKDKFTFTIVGRWEYRKATTEMIRAFIDTFKNTEDVELLLLVDNPFDKQKMTTEDKMIKNGLRDRKIKILHKVSQDDYDQLIRETDCFISCSRAEGWNLPLHEFMACGIPAICSDWSGQLEFADKHASLVKIASMKKAWSEFGSFPGDYGEPDFDHLSDCMLEHYVNRDILRQKALDGSDYLRSFTWENAAQIALKAIEVMKSTSTVSTGFTQSSEVKEEPKPAPHHIQIKNFFINGAFVEIIGPESPNKYKVSFTDRVSGQVVHQSELDINHWTRTNRQYFTDWNVKITSGSDTIYNKDISYDSQRVMIVLDSKAMGDTLAWFPMVEEFRKKHNAKIICVTFWNKFFKDKYPEISFVEPGSGVPDIIAQYNVGCFDNDLNRNKFNWRITPLQKVAADILGITPYKEVLPKVAYKKMDTPINGKYVAISEHSTFMCKYWLYPDGWKIVIKYLNSIGYKVAVLSKEATELEGIINLTGKPIGESINTILNADLFIGVSSGPSWLSWALGKSLVLVSGYSTDWAEMSIDNPLISRVINKDVCHGCFNDPSLPLERGNWRWCPRGRDFECSKLITPEMVIEGINKQLGIIGDKEALYSLVKPEVTNGNIL